MANDRQISQLVLQVDANIAVAQRELQQLARVVQQQTGNINASLGTTEVANQRMGRAFGQARIAQMELSHVVTASVDAYAAGFSPLRIMTLEMGRLAEAATFLGGGGGGVLGKVAAFMSGPWGIAVLLGVSVLSQLIGKASGSSDAVADLVEKMRQHAKEAANQKTADEIWAHSIDGIIERNEKLIDTLKKRLQAEEDLDNQELRKSLKDRAVAERDLPGQQTARTNVLRELSIAQRDPSLGTNVGGPAEAKIQALKAQLADIDAAIANDRKAISDTQGAITESTIAIGEAEGKALTDTSARIDLWSKRYLTALHEIEAKTPEATTTISAAFYAMQKALQDAASAKVDINGPGNAATKLANQLRAGVITVDQYAASMAKLVKQLNAATKAAEDAKKGSGEFGKQIGFSDAEAIAKSAGLTVTSSYRPAFGHGTPGHQTQEDLYNNPAYNRPGNPVARPGASAHNGVNGKWALDIAFADGLTPQKLRKIYGDQGVTLSAIYKEKGHFHIEGSRSQAAAEENAAKRAQVSGIRTAGAFDQASDRLNQELLQAKLQLTGDYHEQARIAGQQVDAETKKLMDSIQEQQDLGAATGYQQGITKAQADILRTKAQELGDTKKSAIALHEYEETLSRQQRAADQKYQYQVDDLHFLDDMATTQAAHRKLQLDILDIVYQQKEYDLRIALAKAEQAKDAEATARIQADLARLPTDKAEDQGRVRQGTMDPLQAWMKQVPHDAATINEALQSIATQGFDNLANSITDVITGTKSLGAAFKDIANEIIADIIRMTIKMLIFKAISAALGSFGGGGGGGGGLDSGSINSSLGLDNGLPGFANGGMFSVGGNGGIDKNVLSINGVPRAKVSANENIAVLPRTPRMSFGGAGGGGARDGKTEIVVHVEASEDFNVKVAHISGQQVAAAAPAIVRAASQNTVRSLTRPRLMGR